jgi:FkbM family methyltransferase
MMVERQEDLIFDVGLHTGQDTDYYLKKGFRVVAFEAEPVLVEENRARFRTEIDAGRLVIVEGAIVEDPTAKTVTFFKNVDNDVWGTVDPNWAERNESLGTRSTQIEVAAVSFSKCIAKYGVPYFMKIDIEGADMVCLRCLREFDVKPNCVSIESDKVSFDALLSEINLLKELGYREFIAVQQRWIQKTQVPTISHEGENIDYRFTEESSGLFGKDLTGPWKQEDQIVAQYREIFEAYRKYGDGSIWKKYFIAKYALKAVARLVGKPIPGWYDTHARLPEE